MATGPSERRRARVVAGACVVAIGLVAAGWLVLSARQASAVHVLLPAGALSCDGTTVDLGDVSSVVGDEIATPLAQITEDMRCRLDVRIENRSSADAAIQQLSLPVLGPEGGPGVEAVALDGAAIEPREGEVDAVFDFEPAWTIPAGSAETFGLLFETKPDGCTGERMTIAFLEQPTLAVSVLGRAHERSVLGTGFGFRGSSTTDCDQ